jgi:hypothetical protein
MATGAYADIADELKVAYPPGTFEEPVNKETKYRRDLNRVDLKMNEGIATFPLGIASAWNVGMIPDIGDFPTPIDPTRVQGQVKPELFVGSFQIGVVTKAAAKSTKGTFSNGGILSDRVEATVSDLGKYLNRVYAGSHYGRLATVETNDGGSKLTLAEPLGGQLLAKNMRIAVYDALLGGALRGTAENRKITVLNKDTREVTYSGADEGTIAAGDHVFMTGSYDRLINTLPMIVGDVADAATIFTKSRTTYPELSAIVLRGENGLRNLNEQLILEAIDKPRQETGKRITRALSNSGQARKYVEFIQGERRYAGPQGSSPKYTVGYDEESLQIVAPGVNCKLEVDFDIHPRRIYFLAWETFGLYEAMPVDWIDDDALLKMIPTSGGHKAGFLAYVGSVENQLNTMPRASSRLEDLNDPLCGD